MNPHPPNHMCQMSKQLSIQDCKAAAITPSQNAFKKSASMSFAYYNKGKPAGTASCRQAKSTSVNPSAVTVIPSRRLSPRLAKRSGLGNTTAVSSPRARSIDVKLSTVSTRVADDASASRVACFEKASIDDDASSATEELVFPQSITDNDNAFGKNTSTIVIDDDSSSAFSSKEPATNHVATSFTTPRLQDVADTITNDRLVDAIGICENAIVSGTMPAPNAFVKGGYDISHRKISNITIENVEEII